MILLARLDERRAEIEQATLTRVYAISDPTDAADPTYAESLRAAVSAAIDYGLGAIEQGDRRTLPVPPLLLMQARLAVRSSISLDTVLRRYFAGYALLGDFLVDEAQEAGMLGPELKSLLRTEAVLFDRLLAIVSDEYNRESVIHKESVEDDPAERIERLLAGELLDTSSLAYDFDGWHLGIVAAGEGAADGVRQLAASCDCRLILVRQGEATAWAWLGSRQRTDLAELAWKGSLGQVRLALGEPGERMAGWRLTHRQAKAALPLTIAADKDLIRYADVVLISSVLRDDLLATSLRELFLRPLAQDRDGGEAARETLRAYFKAERNISSAAAALGLNRNTVANRLQAIEESIGRPLTECAAELEAALRLDELRDPSSHARLAGC